MSENSVSARTVGLLGNAASYLFLVIVTISAYEVLMRYAVGQPTVWVHELSIALAATCFVIGGPYVHRSRRHITISYLYEKMSAQPQEALVFDALAGHTYQIKAHFEVPFFLLGTLESYADEIVPFIWIEDKESGEMVVGDRPPPGQGDDG